jgi:hypothetical protein
VFPRLEWRNAHGRRHRDGVDPPEPPGAASKERP